MRIDVSKYRVNVPKIGQFTAELTAKERFERLSLIAIATHCPIIVVAYYVGELYGFTPDIEKLIYTCMKFYRVLEVYDADQDYGQVVAYIPTFGRELRTEARELPSSDDRPKEGDPLP